MKTQGNSQQNQDTSKVDQEPKGQPKGVKEGEGPTGVPGSPPERPPGGWVPPTAGESRGMGNTGTAATNVS